MGFWEQRSAMSRAGKARVISVKMTTDRPRAPPSLLSRSPTMQAKKSGAGGTHLLYEITYTELYLTEMDTWRGDMEGGGMGDMEWR